MSIKSLMANDCPHSHTCSPSPFLLRNQLYMCQLNVELMSQIREVKFKDTEDVVSLVIILLTLIHVCGLFLILPFINVFFSFSFFTPFPYFDSFSLPTLTPCSLFFLYPFAFLFFLSLSFRVFFTGSKDFFFSPLIFPFLSSIGLRYLRCSAERRRLSDP